MIKNSDFIQKLAFAVSSLALTIMALLLCQEITVPPKYHDFIVGSLSWRGGTKLQDILSPLVILLVACTSFIKIPQLFNRYSTLFGHEAMHATARSLLWWSLPFILGASTFLSGVTSRHPFLVSGFAIPFCLLGMYLQIRQQKALAAHVWGIALFATLLLALLPAEVALVLGRFDVIDGKVFKIVRLALPVFIILLLALILHLRYWPDSLQKTAARFLCIGQLGLAALFTLLYPAALQQPDGSIYRYPTTIWLPVTIGILMFWASVDIFWRYRKYAKTQVLTSLFSPAAMLGLWVLLYAGHTTIPVISPDDYHYGEKLLGVWQYLQGAIPYIDYVPPHGLVEDDMGMFLSQLFYDGTAGTWPEAYRLQRIFIGGIAFYSVWLFSGSIGLAFLVAFFGGRFMLFTPFLCLWLHPDLRARPALWWVAWVITAPFAVFAAPGQGMVLVAASGIIALHTLWEFYQLPLEKRTIRPVLVAGAGVLLLAILTPLGEMAFGAVRYVLQNASINQVAYGSEWGKALGRHNEPLVELMRSSWMGAAVAYALCIYFTRKDTRYRSLTVSAVFALAFLLLLMPYSMGRIPGSTSLNRLGNATELAWIILLPLTLWPALDKNKRFLLVLFIAIIGAALHRTPIRFDRDVFEDMARSPLLRSGTSIALPKLGTTEVLDEAHWTRLETVKKVLDSELAPQEPYIDLSSRNALYFYLNRRPPVPVTATYNMASLAQQKKAVEHLEQNMPEIALIDAQNIMHDGGGAPLRAPYLYRFIIEKYQPQKKDGIIIGHLRDESLQPIPLQEEIRLLEEAFPKRFLRKIPISWGRSIGGLEDRMQHVRTLGDATPAPKTPYVEFDFTQQPVNGKKAGLLRMDVSCDSDINNMRPLIEWWSEGLGKSNYGLRFIIGRGTLIVPLDASPDWMLRPNITKMRITFPVLRKCRSLKLKNVALYQRRFD